MTARSLFLALFVAGATIFSATEPAAAFCGVLQESATAKSVARATRLASRALNREDRKLRRQHGVKYVPSKREVACLGGAVAIDAGGNQIIGNPSCTVTMAFCVNP